jgi:hypothetical protein
MIPYLDVFRDCIYFSAATITVKCKSEDIISTLTFPGYFSAHDMGSFGMKTHSNDEGKNEGKL